ncbi:carbohydrate-binding module family 52 protein [Piedraia hortae CBS 480.64]|uniref:Carbohydrate-binding module family 52 protein n=1 Tax=Piedraia hortae CBS 480.64 TaxID=1314780 RepID=A0A6A7BYI0_9PEZI|nr:carbohydrate-binding module family 52 protein [Piedraia hortae CBS 480.64]
MQFNTFTLLILTALSAAAPVKQCEKYSYNPDNYRCYPGSKPVLCPVIAGVATKPCGSACYSPEQYSCSNNQLVQLPPLNDAFTLVAHHPINSPSNLDGKTIEASGQHFYINRPAGVYCPSVAGGICAASSNRTILFPGALDVVVPGGQEIYVQKNGALAFTQAHSASTTDLAVLGLGGPVYKGGAALGPNGVAWKACPVDGGAWQVFVPLPGVSFSAGCVDFYAHAATADGLGVAWQYD